MSYALIFTITIVYFITMVYFYRDDQCIFYIGFADGAYREILCVIIRWNVMCFVKSCIKFLYWDFLLVFIVKSNVFPPSIILMRFVSLSSKSMHLKCIFCHDNNRLFLPWKSMHFLHWICWWYGVQRIFLNIKHTVFFPNMQ